MDNKFAADAVKKPIGQKVSNPKPVAPALGKKPSNFVKMVRKMNVAGK